MSLKRAPRRCRRVAKGEAGFTLMELFVSLFVFSAGMAGVLALQTAIIKHNSMSSDISLASNLAAAQIEKLRITKYENIGAAASCDFFDPNDINQLTAAEENNNVCYFDKHGQIARSENVYFTRTWTAAPHATLDVTDITVKVRFNFAVVAAGISDTKFITMKGRVFPRNVGP